jgi:HEAT repeat protein
VADNKQIKALGLRFARSLQMTVKTAVMFTINHKSVDRPMQQSFELLNTLLKESGQFTFGFVDNQLILNNLLTTDSSVDYLQTEFLKRGIAAVTFEPGLTMGRFRKVISVIAVSTKEIDDAGGTLNFFDRNPIEGARILPAAKNQKKDEEGDTIIDTDSEAYILSKQMAEAQGSRDFLDSIDALLESGCIDPSVRSEVISEYAARPFDGAGYGVPIPVPNLVAVREGQTVVNAPGGEVISGGPASVSEGSASGSSPGSGATGSGAAPGTAGAYPSGGQESGRPTPVGVPGWGGGSGGGSGPALHHAGPGGGGGLGVGVGGEPGLGYGSGPGSRYAEGSGSGHGSGPGEVASVGRGRAGEPGGGWRHAMGLSASGSGTFMEMVEASVQRSLLEERGDPQKSYTSLARILRNMGVDKILANFPPERRQDLSSLPPEQLAAEYIEDTALQLAGTKLKSADGHAQKILIEEEVIRVLARSLKATHMADRLAQKLAKFVSDFSVPPHLQEKMREELQWSTLTSNKRYDRLIGIKRYSTLEFRRLLDLAKELTKLREMDRAVNLATHYFEFLDDPGDIEVTELSRAPELIRSIPLAQGDFATKTSQRLGKILLRGDVSELIHAQTATALTVLAQSLSSFENFQDVLTIGSYLERSANLDPEKHKRCCRNNLSRLLPASAIERIIELFLQRDSGWAKNAVTLLRFSAPASIDSVFNHLIGESDARNRLALVRLIGQLGKSSIEVAYKHLKDERWYVVRNICGVLSELKDPDLAEHIVPALEHADPRVQQAALKAIVHSRTVRAAPVLAASLAKLAPNVLDEALNELMFLRHVKSIEGLEVLIRITKGNPASVRKAIQVLANIDDDDAVQALMRLLRNPELDHQLRRAVLQALSTNRSPLAIQLLKDFSVTRDSLAAEVSLALKKAAASE